MKTDNWTSQPVTPPGVPAGLKSIFAQMVSIASLSACLRMLGAGVVTISISLFLFQNWDTGNDIQRYFLLLAQTVLLAGSGLLTAQVLREYKGARVFLLLALVASIANFAILGALIYSTVQWDSALGSYPAFSLWQADSFTSVMWTMLVAITVLTPTVHVAFRALSRNSGWTAFRSCA